MKNIAVQEVASLFRAFEKGHRPQAGGLSQQSSLYRQAMSYAEQCRDEAEAYDRKRQAEADRKRGN